MFKYLGTFSCLAILACQNLYAAHEDPVSPWRQTICRQQGSGEEVVLTIVFKKPTDSADLATSADKRELHFSLKSVFIATELGETTIPWKKMGKIDGALVSATHPDNPIPGYSIRLSVPPNVAPPGDFGVIESDCLSKYTAFVGEIIDRMEHGPSIDSERVSDDTVAGAPLSGQASLVAGTFVAWIGADEVVTDDHDKMGRFNVRTGSKTDATLDRAPERTGEDLKKVLDGIRAEFPETVFQKDPVTLREIEWRTKWVPPPGSSQTIVVVPDAQKPDRKDGEFALFSGEGRTTRGEPSGKVGVHNALYALLYKKDRQFKMLPLEISEHRVEDTNGEWNYAWNALVASVDRVTHKVLFYFANQPLESDVAWQAGWSPFNVWWFDPATATLEHVVLPAGPWVADASADWLGRAAGCFSCGCDCYRHYELTVGGDNVFVRITATHGALQPTTTGIYELTASKTSWHKIVGAETTLDQIAPDGCRIAINRPAGVQIVTLCDHPNPK